METSPQSEAQGQSSVGARTASAMPRCRLPTFVLLFGLTLATTAAFAQTTQESPHNAPRIPAPTPAPDPTPRGDNSPGTVLSNALRAVMSSSVNDPNFQNALTALASSEEMPYQDAVLVARVDTGGRTIVDEPKRRATLSIVHGEEEIFSGPIGIEIRGHSSQLFPKKSYGFETWDEDGNDVNVELAGFPKEEDWIFYGPFVDDSFLRNVLVFQMANDIGRYASRTQFVELYINDDYRGVYVLMEKIKRDKNRVDISKNKASDISGGYILEAEPLVAYSPANYGFRSNYDHAGNRHGGDKIAFAYVYPKPRDISQAQQNYIRQYMASFEGALYSENFTDPVNGYAKWIDVDSFIDYFLIYEFSNNRETYRRSMFLQKDKGGKLNMGPLWDFNFAFDGSSSGWVYQKYHRSNADKVYWWTRLFQDPAWVKRLKQRWNSLRRDVLTNAHVLGIIDARVRVLTSGGAQNRDYAKWSSARRQWSVHGTFAQSIFQLKTTSQRRLAWMDSVLALNTDTALTSLTLADSTGNAIALAETFDAATTAYTASVASGVTSVTLAATPRYPGATMEYALGDADFSASPTVTGLAAGLNHITIRVTAEDDTTGVYTLRLAQRAPPPPAPVEQAITLDWPLTPATIGAGNVFRLLYVSGDVGDARETDVAAYNTRIQQSAAAGHTAIRGFSDQFRALVSTVAVNARENTATGHTPAAPGVPIYWLNGDKVADSYADFYDGSWDSRAATDRDGAGVDVSDLRIWTGTRADGSVDPTREAGTTGMVGVGRLDQVAGNEIRSGDADDRETTGNRFYALSPVLRVDGEALAFDTGAVPAPADADATYHYTVGAAIPVLTLPPATGGIAPLTYTLTPAASLPDGLTFAPATRTLSGTPTTATTAIAAAADAIALTYIVTDAIGIVVTQPFTVTVNPAPTLSDVITTELTYAVAVAVTRTLPPAAGGTAPLTYTLTPAASIPDGLTLDSATRILSGTPTTATATATPAALTYAVTDAHGVTGASVLPVTITIVDAPTIDATIPDQHYIIGQTVTLTLPPVTGGLVPLAYTLTRINGSPVLPPGLTFDAATRAITGSPSVAFGGVPGAHLRYIATDANGTAANADFTMRAGIAPTFDTGAIPAHALAYTYTVGAAIPVLTLPLAVGVAPLIYGLTPAASLPSGLTFNPAGRTLSGTPTTVASAAALTYVVTDAHGATGDALTYRLAVVRAPTIDAPIPDQHHALGPVTLMLPSAVGGLAPLTYMLTRINGSPALPPGLIFDAAARAITGSTSVAFGGVPGARLRYTATDANGAAVDMDFSLWVGVAPVFDTSAVPAPEAAYTYPVGAAIPVLILPPALGVAPLTYRMTQAAPLPPGLIFDPVGRTLSGTPTTATSATALTYAATDATGVAVLRAFKVTVTKGEQAAFAFAAPTLDTTLHDPAFPSPAPIGGSGTGALAYASADPAVATVDAAGHVTLVGAGITTITVTKAGDANYHAATARYTLTVAKTTQALTFAAPTFETLFGDPTFASPAPTGGSGTGALTYASTDPAVATVDVHTGHVTPVAVGITTITATKAGDANYHVTTASYLLIIHQPDKAAQAPLTFAVSTLGTVFGDPAFTQPAAGGTGTGAITYRSTDPAVAAVDVDNGHVTLVGAGMTTITAIKSGDVTYNAAAASYTLTVAKAEQAPLAFPAPTLDKLVIDPAFTQPAAGGAGTGAMAYISADPAVATVDEHSGHVTLVGVGSVTITATKAGDANHHVATASYTLTVAKAEQTPMAFPAPTLDKMFGDPAFTRTAAGGSGEGTVTYRATNAAAVNVSTGTGGDIYGVSLTRRRTVVTVDAVSGHVTLIGVGSAIITATKSGDAHYHPATARYLLTVAKADQPALAFPAPALARAYGDPPFTHPAAAAGAGTGAVTYLSTDPAVATVDEHSGQVTLLGIGSATITATKAADANHHPATARYTLTVTPAIPAAPSGISLEAGDARIRVSWTPAAEAAPTGPSPTGPASTDPSPAGLASTGPSPTGLASTDPSPTGLASTDPSPTDSSPTDSSPTGSSPAGSSPTGPSPTGPSPSGPSPTGSSPAGPAPTGYTATATASGQPDHTCTAGATATTCTITGLTNGVAYRVTVVATTRSGVSDASLAVTATPAAPLRFASVLASRTYPAAVAIPPLALPAAVGGLAPLTYALTPAASIPPGLTFDATARTLTGAPTASAAATLIYTVTDSASPRSTAALTFTVTAVTVTVPDGGTVVADAAGTALAVNDVGSTPTAATPTATTPTGDTPTAATPNAAATATPTGVTPTADTPNDLRLMLPDNHGVTRVTVGAYDMAATPLPVGDVFSGVAMTIAVAPAMPAAATVCLSTAGAPDGHPPVLYHFAATGWDAIGRDTRTRPGFVCGATTTFSPFAVGLDPTSRLTTISRTLLPEVARAITDTTVGAITDRLEQASARHQAGGALTLGGQTTLADVLRTGGQALTDGTLDLRALLSRSAFVLPLASATDAGPARHLTLWGHGAYRAIGGSGGATNWDGSLFSARMGADAQVRDDLLAGAALSWTHGDFDYGALTDAQDAGGGNYTLELTSLTPYAQWAILPSHRLHVWATGGYGWGKVRITDALLTTPQTSDAALIMLGGGLNGQVLNDGDITVRLKSEVMQTSMDLAGRDRIAALTVEARRVRVTLAGTHEALLARGTLVRTTLDIGVRHDGGDGRTGTGGELGGGVAYNDPASRVTVSSHGRALVGHTGDYKDWGIGGIVALEPGQGGQGLALRLAPTYGQTATQTAQLWAQGARDMTVTDAAVLGQRLDATVAYGLATLDGRSLLTPYSTLTWGQGAREYRLGSRLALASGLTMSVEGVRGETVGAGAAHRLQWQTGWRWLTASVQTSGVERRLQLQAAWQW